MKVISLATLGTLITVGLASAAPINPSFETGNFTGWTLSGTPTVAGTTFGYAPSNGAFQAVLQTGVGTQTSAATLATFLGVTTGQLNALTGGGTVAEGQAILQTFTQGGSSFTIAFGVVDKGDTNINSALLVDNLTVAPNGTLSFNWNFLTNELDQGATFNDYAFVSFNGQLVLLQDRNALLSFPGGFIPGPAQDGFDGNTGTQTFSQLFPQLAIPEPATLAVFGGIAVAGLAGYRRRKTATPTVVA